MNRATQANRYAGAIVATLVAAQPIASATEHNPNPATLGLAALTVVLLGCLVFLAVRARSVQHQHKGGSQ